MQWTHFDQKVEDSEKKQSTVKCGSMRSPPSHKYITLLTHKYTHIHTNSRDPGVEDINTLRTESVLSPEANHVSLQ